MATELAHAYVTIIPSLDGASKTIEKELGSVNVDGIGRRLGQSLTSGLTEKIKSASKVAVGTLGTIGGAIGNMAAQGGMARALNIEQAQTMFKGLKLDWEDYKDTINAAVDGTAFSLDAAALVAASLAASGVAAGDDMSQALNACTGIAATFGGDLGDIGGIFQKVAAQGKLTGETIQQFADRGINVTATLAEALGKSGDEIKKMTSAGEIDFKTFSDAMYNAFGDSAAAANETFKGSLGNMKSAISRIGEKFANPIKDNAVPIFNALRLAINAVNTALTPVADLFGEFVTNVVAKVTPALETFTAKFDGLSDKLSDMSERGESAFDRLKVAGETFKGAIEAVFGGGIGSKIAIVASGFVGLGAAFGGLSSLLGVVPGLGALVGAISGGAGVVGLFSAALNGLGGVVSAVATPLGAIAGAIGGVVGLFVAGYAQSETFTSGVKSAFDTFVQNIQTGVSPIQAAVQLISDTWGLLGSSFDEAVSNIGSIGQRLPAPLQTALGVVTGFVTDVKNSLSGVSGGTVAFLGMFAGIATGIAPIVASVLPKIAGLVASVSSIGGVGAALKLALSGVGSALGAVFSPVTLVVAAIAALAAGFIYLMATNEGFRNSIMGLVGQIGQSLAPILTVIGQAITQLATTVLPVIMSLIQQLIPVIGQIITVIFQIVAALAPVIAQIVSIVIPIVTQIITLVVQLAGRIISAVLPVISTIASVISQVLPSIMVVVTDVMNTIQSIIETVWPIVEEIIVTVVDTVASIIEEVMPVISTYIEAAMNLIQGIIENVWPAIQGIIETVMGVIQGVISVVMGIITGDWEGAWEGVQNLLSDIWEGIGNVVSTGIDTVVNFIKELPGKILGFFSNAGDLLMDAGKNIIDGFLEGLTAAFEGVKDFVGGIGDWIFNNKGPKAYDLGLLIPNGQWIMQSLETGLENGQKGVLKNLTSFTDDLKQFDYGFGGDFDPSVSRAFNYIPVVETNGDSGQLVINGNVTLDASKFKNERDLDQFRSRLYRELKQAKAGA